MPFVRDTINEPCNEDGDTALLVSAQMGYVNIVKYLVEQCDAGVNVLSRDGVTPLHMSCEKGHYIVTKYLLDHGADVHLNDKPIMAATTRMYHDIVGLLQSFNAMLLLLFIRRRVVRFWVKPVFCLCL